MAKFYSLRSKISTIMASIIEVSNLTKKFKEFKAVDNISFNVAKGEIFAFLETRSKIYELNPLKVFN